jgi:hypothetical protein
MDALTKYAEEEHRVWTLKRLGVFLILGFIFPLYMSGFFGESKLIFINIVHLGSGEFPTKVGLLYPLIAGVALLLISLKEQTMFRPFLILVIGLFPLLLSMMNENDFMTSNILRYNKGIDIMFFLMLALVGLFLGSKRVSESSHICGRIMGGISGIIFLFLIFIPLDKTGVPLFWGVLELLNTDVQLNVPGSITLFSVALIVIISCFIYVSVIAIINITPRPNSQKTATRGYRIILYATYALPTSIFLVILFSPAAIGQSKLTVFTLLMKMTFLLSGLLGTIVAGFLDLLDQIVPSPVKGSEL